MGLTHRLKPGDVVRVGDDISFRVLSDSYGTNIRVDVDAPRSVAIVVEKQAERHTPIVAGSAKSV